MSALPLAFVFAWYYWHGGNRLMFHEIVDRLRECFRYLGEVGVIVFQARGFRGVGEEADFNETGARRDIVIGGIDDRQILIRLEAAIFVARRPHDALLDA